MITVKFLGGAKKSFSADKLEIQKDMMTVADLLDYLQKSISYNKPRIDIQNLLVAVNGIDSSVLGGNAAYLKDGDVVSIIPVVHGGSTQ